MFKTNMKITTATILATLGMSLMASATAMTIDDLANAQRQKLASEAKASEPPSAPVVFQQSKPKRSSAAAYQPYTVHAIYRSQERVVAEVTDGQNLISIKPGMKLGNMVVTSLTERGVLLAPLPECKRKCAKVRLVPVGGAL